MRNLSKSVPSLALLATLALFAVACGGTGDPGADDSVVDDGSTPETPAVPGAPNAPDAPGAPDAGQQDPGVDVFGVTMIYPSKSGGEEWFLSESPDADKRFDPQNTITRNSDGSWKMKSSKVRMNVYTSTGYDTKKIRTQNRDELAAQGYMQAPNDWKNVEMTGFVKVNAASDMSDNFAWYARGGRHNDSLACEGAAYKGDLHYDGRARWAKESWHVSYDYKPYQSATSSLKGRWVGWKIVMRNIEQDGKTAVKLESYLNDNGDGESWEKVYEWIDDGTWAGDHGTCGAKNAKMPMTWGGPTATFRWDSASDVDFKWMSVREIDPGASAPAEYGTAEPESEGPTAQGPTGSEPTEPEPTTPAPGAPETPSVPPTAPAPGEGPSAPDLTPPATSDLDVFGVTMLYPSKVGGEEWFLSSNPGSDKRFNPQDTITQNPDGSWKMKSTKVRMGVYTSTGYDGSKIKTQNRDQLAAQGYMQAPNDWKNVEMTGFVKLNAANDMTDNFTWYARGGRHNDTLACEGSAYKGDLYYDGRARWAKESWHVSYDYQGYKPATSSLKGRWVGWKAVMRNVEVNGKTVVHLTSYVNENADKVTWKKVYDWVDDGTWAGDHATCGAKNTKMPITWGGPTATFRWDSATDVDFKWLSVREIQP